MLDSNFEYSRSKFVLPKSLLNGWKIPAYFLKRGLTSSVPIAGVGSGKVPFLNFSMIAISSPLNSIFWLQSAQILVFSLTHPEHFLHFNDINFASEFESSHLLHLQSKLYRSFNSFFLSSEELPSFDPVMYEIRKSEKVVCFKS